MAVTEFIAGLAPEERFVLANPRIGIAAKCKFLPSIGDMVELLLAEKAKREQFKPAHTTYRRFEPDTAPGEPLDHRKRVVAQTLGYDPHRSRHAIKPAFETVGFDVMEEARLAGKPPPLKTPPRPASDELKRMLVEQGAGHLLRFPTEFPPDGAAA